jgi:hypothetical protein
MKLGAGLAGRANPTALFIGGVAVVSTVAIVVGLVIFATRGDGGDGDGSSTAASSSSSTSSTSTSTTTTTAPPVPTTPAPGAVVPNGGQTGGQTNGQTGTQQPNRAYSDPEDPVYESLPLPFGISATLTPGSCTWSSVNGGELQAAGTISASPETDDAWFVTVYWLQNERELDDQFEMYEVEPGQTVGWRLTTSAPLPPAEPFRCALEIE